MNLLFLVADMLRWDYPGAYGNGWVQTPNLDRLARESVVFENAFAEGLPTLPARPVMQTGRPIVPFRYVPQPDDMVQFAGWHPAPSPNPRRRHATCTRASCCWWPWEAF